MPRTRPPRKATPARRRKTTSPEAALRHELNTKRRGELAELAFTLKAASLGFGVARPYGDSERYDCILDSRHIDLLTLNPSNLNSPQPCRPERSKPASNASGPAKSKDSYQTSRLLKADAVSLPPALHRIQIKCSTQLINGLYRLNAHRRIYGRAVPYLLSEIDFIAAYIIPEDSWFIIPLPAILGRTSLLFRRKEDPKPGRYDQYREAWHLLKPNV